jgi:hypothetical protein
MPAALTWTAHPARRRPHHVALVAAVVRLTCSVVISSLESFFLAALAAVVLVIAVAPFLLPTRYTLDDEGVEERRMLRRRTRRWADLRRVQIGPEAALVSPFAAPNRLDRYRGLIVMFDGADRAAVVSFLKEKVRREAAE